mmetsp:Transcript_6596/g.17993  ORF Transcript_6596/g.17993 Transcript_6596/m.17993 type:complete len:201 (+) Transcript_6596:822-1424(+)
MRSTRSRLQLLLAMSGLARPLWSQAPGCRAQPGWHGPGRASTRLEWPGAAAVPPTWRSRTAANGVPTWPWTFGTIVALLMVCWWVKKAARLIGSCRSRSCTGRPWRLAQQLRTSLRPRASSTAPHGARHRRLLARQHCWHWHAGSHASKALGRRAAASQRCGAPAAAPTWSPSEPCWRRALGAATWCRQTRFSASSRSVG